MRSRAWPSGPPGSTTLRIRSVAAIAKTPSLNASSRLVLITSCGPLDEFDDDTFGSLNVEACGAVKCAARLVDRDGVARQNCDARRLQPVLHSGQVIDGEGEVYHRPVVQLKGHASTRGLSVFDELHDPSIARVEIGDVELDRFKSQQGRSFRVAECTLRQDAQTEQVTVKAEREREFPVVDADVIYARYAHRFNGARRGGMRSRAKTSSTVSPRFTSSA